MNFRSGRQVCNSVISLTSPQERLSTHPNSWSHSNTHLGFVYMWGECWQDTDGGMQTDKYGEQTEGLIDRKRCQPATPGCRCVWIHCMIYVLLEMWTVEGDRKSRSLPIQCGISGILKTFPPIPALAVFSHQTGCTITFISEATAGKWNKASFA